MISDEQLSTIKDFAKFAPKFLNIRTKSGEPKLFAFNRAQQYLHRRLEDQKKETGRVRAVILKGRQQGCCFGLDIKVGDRLVACDEEKIGITSSGRRSSRKFKTATVEMVRSFKRKTLEVIFDNGVVLNLTPEHRMLCKKRGGDSQEWRK